MCGAFAVSALILPGAAAAKTGDVYLTDDNSTIGGTVWRLGLNGGVPTAVHIGAPLDEPSSLAYDRNGDLLVANDVALISRIDLPSGAISTYATGPPLGSPDRIAVGPDGAVYVTDIGATDEFYRIDPVTRAVTTVAMAPAISAPRGVAISRDGFAFLGNFSVDAIYKVDLATGAVTTIPATPSPLLTGPAEVTLSPDERFLYFANRQLGNEHVGRIELSTGAVTKVADVEGPHGIAQLRDGGLLANSSDLDLVHRISPAGALTTFSAGPGYGFLTDVVVEPALCSKRFPTVVGTDAAEVLRGSPFPDVIRGEGGKDEISGLGGKDVICGGKGKDLIRGGAGKDTLRGEGGRDRLVGGKGRDSCNGGKGKDRKARGCERVAKVP